jgi:hypothetical protein
MKAQRSGLSLTSYEDALKRRRTTRELSDCSSPADSLGVFYWRQSTHSIR